MTLPDAFQRVILEKVHHSQESLDALVNSCADLIRSEYFVDEKIKLGPTKSATTTSSKSWSGVITSIDKTPASNNNTASSTQNGSSPNSDKENDVNLKPYSYTVTVTLSDTCQKSIKAIPAKEITRTLDVPSVEAIRDFLSTSAFRRAEKSYWIVKDLYKEKFKIADKVASIFASPGPSKSSSLDKKPMSAQSKAGVSDRNGASTPPPAASNKSNASAKVADIFGDSSSGDEDPASKKSNASAKVVDIFDDSSSGDEDPPKTDQTNHSEKTPAAKIPEQRAKKSLPISGLKKSPETALDAAKEPQNPVVKKPAESSSVSSSSGDESTSSSSSDDEGEPAVPVRRSLGLPPTGKAAGKVIKAKEKEREQKVKERVRMKKEKEKQKKREEQEKERARKRMETFLKKSSSAATIDLTLSDEESSRPAALATPAHMLNAAKRKNALKVLSKSGTKNRSSMDSKMRPVVVKKTLSANAGGTKKQKSIFDGLDSDSSGDDMPLSQSLKTPPKLNKQSSKPTTPKLSSFTPSQMLQLRRAATVTQLERALKQGAKSKRFLTEVTIAARTLDASYLESIQNPVIREAVRDRQEKMKEEEMLKKLTEEERKEYLEKKKEMQRRRTREKKRIAALESRKRFEETELSDLKTLPEMEPVTTAENVPNECFGDVAMVTEFFSCYSDFLNVKDSKVSSYELMQALAAGKDGFIYVSQILVPLLQTLLQDEVAKDYQYLSVQLMKMDVNVYNAGEMVRLCLRPRDQDFDDDENQSEKPDSDTEDDSFQAQHVETEILDELEDKEFFELAPSHQLKILVALIHRLLDCYGVNEFQESSQGDSRTLWKERMQILMEKNQEKEADKKLKEKKFPTDKIMEAFGVKTEEANPTAMEEKKEEASTETTGDEESPDLTKKSRRETRAQREEQEKKEMEQRRMEAMAQEKIQKREASEKRIEAGMKAAKRVQRLQCLGTDRDHNRYWIFSKATPGLFIEKGWVSDFIDYCADIPPVQISAISENLDVSEQNKSSMSGRVTPMETDETTVPRPGQNLWFQLKGPEKLEELLSALHPKGSRESYLREQINHMSGKITQILNAANSIPELKTEDSKAAIVETLKNEILDTEARIRSGGLGGVDDFDMWTTKLQSAEEAQTIAECLLQSQEFVKQKFLKGIMAVSEKKKPEQEQENEGTLAVSTTKKLERWKDAVREAGTFSKLHILHQIFNECIEWGKSLDNVKCKICKRKGFDDQLLLCDECDVGYHMFCLRPRVKRIPEGDWFCASCKLTKAPRRNRYTEEESAESGEDSEDEGRKKKGGKKGGKRKATVYSPALSSDEESKPSRKAKVRAQAAIRETESTEDGQDRSETREMTKLQQTCEEVVKKLTASRLTASLTTLPKNVGATSTRSSKGKKNKNREIDLTTVKNKLDLYVDLEELFDDLKDVLDYGRRVYEGQSRKISQLDELSAVLISLEEAYLGQDTSMHES